MNLTDLIKLTTNGSQRRLRLPAKPDNILNSSFIILNFFKAKLCKTDD
jgi:hypothetical protein